MDNTPRMQFVVILVGAVLGGFIAGAVFFPPDPVTQGVNAAVAVVAGLVVGYVVAYRTTLLDDLFTTHR